MTYRLAIFDFDGTLADSFPFFVSVFNQIADQIGFSRIDPSQAERLRHAGTREVMRHVGMPVELTTLPLDHTTNGQGPSHAGVVMFAFRPRQEVAA